MLAKSKLNSMMMKDDDYDYENGDEDDYENEE